MPIDCATRCNHACWSCMEDLALTPSQEGFLSRNAAAWQLLTALRRLSAPHPIRSLHDAASAASVNKFRYCCKCTQVPSDWHMAIQHLQPFQLARIPLATPLAGMTEDLGRAGSGNRRGLAGGERGARPFQGTFACFVDLTATHV